MGKIVLAIVIAYFLGNISPSTLTAERGASISKKEGSGNAWNHQRPAGAGKKAAAVTLVIDIGKGFLAVEIGFLLAGSEAAMYCALAAFIGHIWPVLFRFKGGKE